MHHIPLFFSARDSSFLLEIGKPIYLVDFSSAAAQHNQHFSPGVHIPLSIDQFILSKEKTTGYLVDFNQLSPNLLAVLTNPDHTIIVCDDRNYIAAARFVWSMHAHGLFNCCIWTESASHCAHFWKNKINAAPTASVNTIGRPHTLRLNRSVITDAQEIEAVAALPTTALVDVRSAEEYSGQKKNNGARGGHIPHAIPYPHHQFYDEANPNQLKNCDTLLGELEALGITKRKRLYCYCHSHMRSSFAYCVFKYIGYPHVAGYPGAYNDWESNPDRQVCS